jgi:hypothetical protein
LNILAHGHAPEEAEANSLIGTPDEIMGKLEALRRAGVEYVIMSFGGSRESLRRFAHEIMPAFSNETPPREWLLLMLWTAPARRTKWPKSSSPGRRMGSA